MDRRTLFKQSFTYGLLLVGVSSYANEEKSQKMNVKLIITFKIKKEKLVSFMEIIKDVKENLPQVEGCKGVKVFQVHDNKHMVTLVETWESIEAHKKHIEYVVSSGTWEKIASHLEEDPSSKYYHEI